MRHVEGLGWVDSIMGDPSKPQVWNTTAIPPYDVSQYTALFCSQTAMTLFSNHMPEQRAALSGHFMSSSISHPANTITHRIIPRYSQVPLVVTQHATDLFSGDWVMYPGRNFHVAFMQSTGRRDF